MKKSKDDRNHRGENGHPKNGAKSGSGEKVAHKDSEEDLKQILSEVKGITGKLDNLIDNKKSEELYGECFRSLRKQIEYVKDDITSRIQGSDGGARRNESPYRNRERSTAGRYQDEDYGVGDNGYTSELKNANILLIKCISPEFHRHIPLILIFL